jgi:Ca2+:H+ antiporter
VEDHVVTRPGSAVSTRRWISAGVVFAIGVAAGVLHYVRASDVLVFLVSLAALSGLAWLVSAATEATGNRLGPDVTGILQSAFANLPEIFVVLFALAAGQLVVAWTAVIGSIFANALLALGAVQIVGAVVSDDGTMHFEERLPVETTTLLVVAMSVIVLLGLVATSGRQEQHVQAISDISAVLLLIVYGAWVTRYIRDARRGERERGERERGERERAEREGAVDDATQPPLAASLVLLGCAAAASGLVADWFVSSLGPAIQTLHISQQFAGLVIVGIAGNAVENFSGLVFAARHQNDLAISVVIHSVNQIALLVFPILVLASPLLATQLTFQLPSLYIGALGLSALVLWQVTADGRAYLYEGLGLIAVYLIVAVFAFLS